MTLCHIGLLWAVVGATALLRWKLKEAEVSLLDIFGCVVLGTVFGGLIPLAWALHQVKIKKGGSV